MTLNRSLAIVAVAASAVSSAASAESFTVLNKSGVTACYAYDQVVPGTDPDLDIRESRGWTCQPTSSAYLINNIGDRLTLAVYLLPSSGTAVDYVAANPGGRSTAPMPAFMDLTQQYYMRYSKDAASAWTYLYSMPGINLTTYVSTPDPSWVPGANTLGFAKTTGWDFLPALGEKSVTLGPIQGH